jgi:hypothetical protein
MTIIDSSNVYAKVEYLMVPYQEDWYLVVTTSIGQDENNFHAKTL